MEREIDRQLKFCNGSIVYAAPALWNGLPKDLRQFAHPPNPPPSFTLLPLALHSPLQHSTHGWRPNSSSYPIQILLLPHDTLTIITDCNQSTTLALSPAWPSRILAWHRNVKFGYCGLDLVQRRWISWSPWRGFCGCWEVFEYLHYTAYT